jgi:PhnB protein
MMKKMKKEMKGKIMHASLSGGDADLFASDSTIASPVSRKIELSLSGEDESKLRKMFDALSVGGKVKFQLKRESWGDIFGSLTDKYGIDWMVNIATKKNN